MKWLKGYMWGLLLFLWAPLLIVLVKGSSFSAFSRLLRNTEVMVSFRNSLLLGLATAAIATSGELRQWHKVTLTLDGPEASETADPNPFLDPEGYKAHVRQFEKTFEEAAAKQKAALDAQYAALQAARKKLADTVAQQKAQVAAQKKAMDAKEAADKAKFLAQHGQRVRAIATRSDLGASAELIAALPKLEVIACFGVGTDAIDIAAAQNGEISTQVQGRINHWQRLLVPKPLCANAVTPIKDSAQREFLSRASTGGCFTPAQLPFFRDLHLLALVQ